MEQRTRRGTAGPVVHEVFEEVYRRSDDLAARRHPFSGADYFTRRFKHAVMQGQGVYRYRDRPLHLIHNYACEQPAGTAEVPWTCQATVFVMKDSEPWSAIPEGLRPRNLEEGGFALVAEKDAIEVDGAFEAIEPHPSRPLFVGVNHGCCDSESRVSVHGFDGRTVCPPVALYLGDMESSPWEKLPIDGDQLRCPDGRQVKVPATILQEATALVRGHTGYVLSQYRFWETSGLQGDWKEYAGRHGHPPVFAYGDYNGDGASDLAFLLPLREPSRPGVGFGLFCLLSQDDLSFRLVTIEEDEDSVLSRHGLETVRPGRHPTFCGLPGTPPPECHGQPRDVAFPTDAILLYAFETAAVLYVWDAPTGRFRRVQMAD